MHDLNRRRAVVFRFFKKIVSRTSGFGFYQSQLHKIWYEKLDRSEYSLKMIDSLDSMMGGH